MTTIDPADAAPGSADNEYHEGGCVCGAIRYRTTGQPANVIVCHCTWCQRRTGSGFAVIPKFTRAQFELLSGDLNRYRSTSDESGRWLDLEFCPNCGTNIGFLQELRPDAHAIDAGTFDDPSWLAPDRQWFRYIFVRSSQAWSALPEGVEHHHGHFLDKEGPGKP